MDPFLLKNQFNPSNDLFWKPLFYFIYLKKKHDSKSKRSLIGFAAIFIAPGPQIFWETYLFIISKNYSKMADNTQKLIFWALEYGFEVQKIIKIEWKGIFWNFVAFFTDFNYILRIF